MIAGQNPHAPANRRLYAIAFGFVLKELRERDKLSQSAAAERVGISRRSWSRYESGSYVPLVGQLIHFAVAFDVDPRWFFGRIIEHRDELAETGAP